MSAGWRAIVSRTGPVTTVARDSSCERRQVFADGVERRAVALQEQARRGAAAEGFDADCAGAGVSVHENGACDAGLQDIEERFPQAVGGGARGEPGNALQAPGTELSGDDAHQPTVTSP